MISAKVFLHFQVYYLQKAEIGKPSEKKKKALYNECIQYYSKLFHVSASYFFPILLTAICAGKLSFFQHIICISVISYYIWICDCFCTVVGQVSN